MKSLVLVIFVFFYTGINIYCQSNTFYYSSDFGILNSSENARYKKHVEQKSANRTIITTYDKNGEIWLKLKKEKIKCRYDSILLIKRTADKFLPQLIVRYYSKEEDGQFYFRDKLNGSIINKGKASNLIPLHFQDTLYSFYPKGILKSVAVYDSNRLIGNKNWLLNGKPYYDNIFYFVDRIPEYSMGQEHFRAYILSGIKESGIDLSEVSDRVEIGWVVMEDGEATGFNAISGAYSDLNNLLITIIRDMPGEWIPANLNGEPVRYYMQIPFNFIDRTEGFESLEFSSGFVVWD